MIMIYSLHKRTGQNRETENFAEAIGQLQFSWEAQVKKTKHIYIYRQKEKDVLKWNKTCIQLSISSPFPPLTPPHGEMGNNIKGFGNGGKIWS